MVHNLCFICTSTFWAGGSFRGLRAELDSNTYHPRTRIAALALASAPWLPRVGCPTKMLPGYHHPGVGSRNVPLAQHQYLPRRVILVSLRYILAERRYFFSLCKGLIVISVMRRLYMRPAPPAFIA
eukprot:COSAG01_NODE_2346_length_7859_cov_60.187500_3_plen_126_part_00